MVANKQVLNKVAKEFRAYVRNEYLLDKYSLTNLSALKKTSAIEPGNSAKVLNTLLSIYEKIKPDWVSVHNKNEVSKDKTRALSSGPIRDYFSVKLNDDVRISDFFSNNDGKDDRKNFEDFARIIHISNKIAHEFENRAKSNVFDIIKSDKTDELKHLIVKNRNNKTGEDKEEIKKDFWDELFKNSVDATTVFFQNETLPEVSRYVKERIRNPRSEACEIARRDIELKTRSSEYGLRYIRELKKIEALDYICERYNLEYSGLQQLSADGLLYMASNAYKTGMSIKDDYLTILPAYCSKKTLKNISLGYDNDVVYIDLPGYGNFSVHMQRSFIRKAGYSMYPFKFDEKDTRREPLVLLPMKDGLKDYFDELKNDPSWGEDYGIDKYSEKAKELFRTVYAVLDLDLTRADKDESLEKKIRIAQSLRHHIGVLAGLPPYMLKFIRFYDSMILKHPEKDPFDIEDTFLEHLSKRMPTIEKNLCKERPSIRSVYLGLPSTYKFSKPGKRLKKHKYNKNLKNNTQERDGRND